jgi:hypothetical protein
MAKYECYLVPGLLIVEQVLTRPKRGHFQHSNIPGDQGRADTVPSAWEEEPSISACRRWDESVHYLTRYRHLDLLHALLQVSRGYEVGLQ